MNKQTNLQSFLRARKQGSALRMKQDLPDPAGLRSGFSYDPELLEVVELDSPVRTPAGHQELVGVELERGHALCVGLKFHYQFAGT